MKKIGLLASLLSAFGFGGCTGFQTISVTDFEQCIENQDVQLIDVRTSQEYGESHIEGAMNIDWQQPGFVEKVKEYLDKSRPVALYCRSGRRSAQAASALAEESFEVIDLQGGITAWTGAGLPVVTYEYDLFTTEKGKTLRFTTLTHASIRIDYDSKVFYIDPVSRQGNRTFNFSEMPKATYIIVTHEHGDHFDKQAIADLSDAATRLVTNARCAEQLGYGTVMANGDNMDLDSGITLQAVPAYNYSEGRTQFHPQGRDNGFILTVDGLRIYIAGDTEDIPEMAQIKDVDVAFMPCNQPYTMTVDQLVKAAGVVKPRVLFPYHYSSTDLTGLAERLQGVDVRIRHYE